MSQNIENLAVNTIRALSVDAVQKANSGHPGMPLGAAPIAYTIWSNHLNFNPNETKWMNRDRFILSAGHASALLYSLLHLHSFDVSLDDLKEFRQFGSKTPGHPEYGHTEGVEATTGPLGAGLSTAVGLAMAQEHMAAKYNKDGYPIIDNFTFVLAGDGDMMEGITSEASSLAGTLELGRLIVLYDSNSITIEGSTDIAFKENVRARYEAYGFETFLVEDGNDLEAINAAIVAAKSNLDKPSFIEVRTKIGFGTDKEGSSKAHGAPIGEEAIIEMKKNFNYPSMEPFYVDDKAKEHFSSIVAEKVEVFDEWEAMFAEYSLKYPELAKQWADDFSEITVEDILNIEGYLEFEDKPQATRNVSGIMINRIKDHYPNMIGGSADLASSNMTFMNGEESFSADNYGGRNLHFGVREHAMAAIGNGLTLYGGLKPYVATFFVFSDFLKPMLRLSALMSVPLTYVLTHDSIGVGEDGPTHEPVEQLTMLRSIPNTVTFRPADAKETAYGWALAMTSKTTPVSLILTRQNLPQLENTGIDALKGAYIVHEPKSMDLILMASGSEVSLAIESAKALEKDGIGARVVSVPSMELFKEQTSEYKESVLPIAMRKRIAIEAASSMSWGHLLGLDGDTVTLDHFGGSAPGDRLFEEFGFTVDNVVNKAKKLLK
ncbi:transketolase [Erysipelothrix urinaevulpis]|uniref:transketolase n=1 Tax=Erysipelothrix urinaevulpis TaxID=2683717 RepID=UPI001356752C|nr:transketolase [Erysipelothrix urinaevulpis]